MLNLSEQITYSKILKMTTSIRKWSWEDILQQKIFFLEIFVIAGQNSLESSSRKSCSLSHRCPPCFLLGPWTQQQFPIWFSEKEKEDEKPVCTVPRMLTPSPCFLLWPQVHGRANESCSHAGSIPCWRAIWLMKVVLSFWLWLERRPDLVPTGGEGWEFRARDRSPGQEQRLCATVPGNNYLIPMLWVCLSQGWGHMCEPV